MYLLDSPPTTMAICGVWGMGKSSFMQMMEKAMLLEAAGVVEGERLLEAAGVTRGVADVTSVASMSEKDKLELRRRAKPKLMCAWFNAW